MKICKKIALTTMVFLILITLNVYAVDLENASTKTTAEVTLTPSATTVKLGDTVKITISAKYEKRIEGLDATLEYDKTKLEMTGLEALNYYSSFSGTDDATGEFKFTVMYGDVGAPEETPKDAEIAVISFKVLDKVIENEEIKVKLSEIEVSDPDYNSVTPEDEQTILTVDGEKSPEGGTPEGEKPEGGNPESSKPEDEKTEGGKPEGENPQEGKPEGGNSEGDNQEGGKTEESNPENEKPKDPTIADKPINNSGLETYGLIVLLIVIVSFILCRKCQKYKGVK